ncbi:hypothetical protein RJ640_000184 [Escallonia rubra]|uniref:Peptidase C19 ubiquitin carboxyl-terminal hydrolase domain-containing protein n=1 Tax=Escallonia rubra TaxID=112253 RepID=A0AA88RGZ9_9ASTE|nr:hypothetical protein RJ640_000184 [Escallonia rubra]
MENAQRLQQTSFKQITRVLRDQILISNDHHRVIDVHIPLLAVSVLTIGGPGATVGVVVGSGEGAEALHPTRLELALEGGARGRGELALTGGLVALPVALVHASVGPEVLARSLRHVAREAPDVQIPVLEVLLQRRRRGGGGDGGRSDLRSNSDYIIFVILQLLDENRWYNFDDSHITPINEEDVKSAAAYALFYRRVKADNATVSNGAQSSAGHNNFLPKK